MGGLRFVVRTFGEDSPCGKMWCLESSLLPPGVNQMYKTGRLPVSVSKRGTSDFSGPGLPATADKWRSALFLSNEAKVWKNTFLSFLPSAGKGVDLGEGPFCAGLYLFVPLNFDADNRLKMLNDIVQGIVVKNDKLIQRSVQFKTVSGNGEDKRFLYCLAPMENFHKMVGFLEGLSEVFESQDGRLKKEMKKCVEHTVDDHCRLLGASDKMRSV